jgi:hypothetical protein
MPLAGRKRRKSADRRELTVELEKTLIVLVRVADEDPACVKRIGDAGRVFDDTILDPKERVRVVEIVAGRELKGFTGSR